MVGRAGNGTGA
jgi:hypothetical protein